MVTYFFDTYALVEIEKGSKNYEPYKKADVITTKLNIMEFYFSLLTDLKEDIAEEGFEYYSEFCIGIPDDILKEAVQFKLEITKKLRKKDGRPSYVDCIGYVLSKKLGIKFLTGDKLFENLDNVEYVK
ncbi:MAG: PIN domain-containing protein [Nanoarchaeota archaeon]|nr:PIN domain-containing protein [Nanoarchaeota archaeon]